MKFVTMNFSKKWGMPLLLVILAGLSIKCSTSELDFIDPFEFVTEEFDDVPDVEVVDDPEPEVQEVETGDVTNLEVAGELASSIIQVVESDGTLELAPETEQIVENVGTATNTVIFTALDSDDEEQVTQVLESFNEQEAVALLNEETVLSEQQSKFAAVVEDSPQELEAITAVLPEIQLSDDFLILDEAFSEQLDLPLELFAKEAGSALRLLTLVGPCAENAEAAYAEAVAVLEEQRDGNVATIEANYQRRLAEAEARFSARTIAFEAQYSAAIGDIIFNVGLILDAAQRSAALGDLVRSRQLLSYAFIYSYYARVLLFDWAIRSREVIRLFRLQEIATAQSLRDSRLLEVTNNFNLSLASADESLEVALGSCHNQGAGN